MNANERAETRTIEWTDHGVTLGYYYQREGPVLGSTERWMPYARKIVGDTLVAATLRPTICCRSEAEARQKAEELAKSLVTFTQ